MKKNNKKIKAVGLLSGGLDSILAAKIISSQGIEVCCMHFLMPWSISKGRRIKEIAEKAGLKCDIFKLDNKYLEIVKDPQHGYGAAINPCADCHKYMLIKAKKYMDKIKASFVFTGEVLGQRPMSQLKQSLSLVARKSGLEGKLVRPLSAKVLEPTIPEREGLVSRKKLLSISGRSRKEQQKLAKKFKITDFIPTGGGCLLTDKNFANRLKDIFEHGYKDYKETIALRWGRHFRLSKKNKVIIGRDEKENNLLIKHVNKDDFAVELADDKPGPTAIIKGNKPGKEILKLAGGLVQNFSKFKEKKSLDIICWRLDNSAQKTRLKASKVNQKKIDKLSI